VIHVEVNFWLSQGFFFKENVRDPIFSDFRDPMIIFSILETRMGSLKRLKKPWAKLKRDDRLKKEYNKEKQSSLSSPQLYRHLQGHRKWITMQ